MTRWNVVRLTVHRPGSSLTGSYLAYAASVPPSFNATSRIKRQNQPQPVTRCDGRNVENQNKVRQSCVGPIAFVCLCLPSLTVIARDTEANASSQTLQRSASKYLAIFFDRPSYVVRDIHLCVREHPAMRLRRKPPIDSYGQQGTIGTSDCFASNDAAVIISNECTAQCCETTLRRLDRGDDPPFESFSLPAETSNIYTPRSVSL